MLIQWWFEVEDAPQGYPRLATFLSSDRNFMQYRGFGYLHARVILALQYDLEVLERELETLDKWDLEDGKGERLKSKALDDSEIRNEELPADCDGQRNRLQVLADLKRKLLEYGKPYQVRVALERASLTRHR